ncbi:hypothetical protein GCM10010493_80760 [Streptomyces lavendulae subsp. grasserius]
MAGRGPNSSDRNRQATTEQRKSSTPVTGYSYVHSAVDDHSRLAYSEVLANERQETAAEIPPGCGSGWWSVRWGS